MKLEKKSTQLKFTRSFPAKGLSKLNKNYTSCNLSDCLHARTFFFLSPLVFVSVTEASVESNMRKDLQCSSEITHSAGVKGF